MCLKPLNILKPLKIGLPRGLRSPLFWAILHNLRRSWAILGDLGNLAIWVANPRLYWEILGALWRSWAILGDLMRSYAILGDLRARSRPEDVSNPGREYPQLLYQYTYYTQ